MNKFLSVLEKKKILVSDGAWGTELMKLGFKSGSCPELWNLEKPDKVFSIAKGYIDSGSDIVSTNSFGASKIKLESFHLADKTYLINKKAAEISREAAEEKLVMGSVGPSGKFLMTGEITEKDLRDSFSLQLKGLIDGQVDAILFETFYDLDELAVGIDVVQEISNIPIICSVTFNKSPDGEFYTLMGNSIKQVYSFLIEKECDLIGVNCSEGYFDTVEIAKKIKEEFPIAKLIVQPNAGRPEVVDASLIYPETPEKIIPAVENFLRLGVSIIGGCCGTNKDHIRKIRELVDNYIETLYS
jgi:5-methyltetrahydrofolate--homocysteine methyltransferase